MTKSCKPAKGMKGCIISSLDNKHFFRVYSDDKSSFIDYKLWHSDLQVQILDEDATLYEVTNRGGSDDHILDHSPQTLGISL